MSQLRDSINQMDDSSKRLTHRKHVYQEVSGERQSQDAKWGPQHWPHYAPGSLMRWVELREYAIATTDAKAKDGSITWQDILYEEICEAFAEGNWAKRRAELIQVMAVIVAEIEDGDLFHEPYKKALQEHLSDDAERQGQQATESAPKT